MIWDAIIAGAGPAGLATAIWARRFGLSVCVVERRQPTPMDKACGEGLMPSGVAALRALGVDPDALRHVPVRGIRYIQGTTVAEGSFSRPGLGIRRTELAEALRAEARAAGIAMKFGAGVSDHTVHDAGVVSVQAGRDTLRTRWLVGADGLHSPIRKRAGLNLQPRGPRRFGVRQHFACPPRSERVEVYWADAAEAYVTPVGPDEIGVAILGRGNQMRFDALLARFPQLQSRLAGARATSSARGAGPFRQRARRRVGDGVALVGDAAGYLDALTGEGVSLALQSAEALAAALAAQRIERYEHDYRRLTRTYMLLTEALVQLAALPKLRRRIVRALAQHPDAFDAFLQVLGEDASPLTLVRSSTCRLLGSAALAGGMRMQRPAG